MSIDILKNYISEHFPYLQNKIQLSSPFRQSKIGTFACFLFCFVLFSQDRYVCLNVKNPLVCTPNQLNQNLWGWN